MSANNKQETKFRLDRVKENTQKEKPFFNIANSLVSVDKNYVDLNDLVEAPTEWNFYGRLNHSKMLELIESIKEIGLQNSIVVWEVDTNKYMILSGHNRVHAYKLLRDNEDKEKYKTISAEIFKKNQITEDVAKQIIIDTNWVQRQLTPMQKSKSIIRKYNSLRSSKSKGGSLNKVIADEYNISEKTIIVYKSLVDLIPEFQELIEDGKLPIFTGMLLSKYDKSIQYFLFNNYDYKTIIKKQSKLKKSLTIESLKTIFAENEKIEIKIELSGDLEDDFLKEIEELKNKYLFKYKVKK